MPTTTYNTPQFLTIKGIPSVTIINSMNSGTVWQGKTLKERNIARSSCLALDEDMMSIELPHYRDEEFDTLRIGKIWEHIINDYYAETIDQGDTPLKHALDLSYKEKQITISINNHNCRKRYGLFGLINPLEQKLINRYNRNLRNLPYFDRDKDMDQTLESIQESIESIRRAYIKPKLPLDHYLGMKILNTVLNTNMWTRKMTLYSSKRELNNFKITYSIELGHGLAEITIDDRDICITKSLLFSRLEL